MENANQKSADIVGEVRGHPLYRLNPSLSQSLPIKAKYKKPCDTSSAYRIVHDTGEIVSQGVVGFLEEQEIDTEQFVKIYLAGIRQYGNLTKAGAKLFEYVYEQMSGHKAKDTDTVTISLNLVKDWHPKLAKTTYYRGLSELLDQGFLFRYFGSEDMYFVNVRYMFNGDRIVLAKSYRRKPEDTSKQMRLINKIEEPMNTTAPFNNYLNLLSEDQKILFLNIFVNLRKFSLDDDIKEIIKAVNEVSKVPFPTI